MSSTAFGIDEGFRARHIGTDADAQAIMLNALGYDSVEALVERAVPASIRPAGGAVPGPSDGSVIPPAATEAEALAELRALAALNKPARPMIGLGYYDTLTPSVIARNVFENPSWYTAYTPYQPEISQGRLEALINFQTMVTDLTGLATANASMLDESTAVVEGMLVARRASKSTSNVFLVDADALPQTKALLAHRAAALGIEIVEVPVGPWEGSGAGFEADVATEAAGIDAFGAFFQYPGASGRVWDPSGPIAAVQAQGGLAVVAADLLALTLLCSPGSLGADIAVGTTQRFGVPLGFGGPHAGYMAVRTGLERQLPGRLVGVSVDASGAPAYRLSLQTREQHIRREKATSNICTAQVLLAVMASMYAVYHGPDGLRRIAADVTRKAHLLRDWIVEAGNDVLHEDFFDTIVVSVPGRAGAVVEAARERGFQLWFRDSDSVGMSVDETTTTSELHALAQVFGGPEQRAFGFWASSGPEHLTGLLPEALRREDEFLTHPVFHVHHSETAMMRYLKQLADRDYALDRGMIPLGSCTMKLNAATEMAAVSWPEFSRVHPFAPADDVAGYLVLIEQLESWLAEITGYDAVSLQPNAGSQGELAGLLAIRGYHHDRGDLQRDVCLIPSSAHGTNAASAVLAGMRVVVVACDEAGNVDLGDLRAKIATHADALAALMITYPSTHGVYEHDVVDICEAVHEAGGQVYVDGANMNALVGLARFGDFGGDVSHLNLHKTFAIPHGGGGPGVGPVAAKAHLAPYLPSHPLAQRAEHAGGFVFDGGPVSAAPYGSASILPISWAYIRLMGTDGLRDATGAAVLAANYVAERLRGHYPVLYAGEGGLVAHECILDLRPLKDETGVTVDDVAKRLIDYGFHAPTMSFPVAGTLMVEPTESEDLGEIERFIEAMIAIRAEAARLQAGEWEASDNPLVNAPHTAAAVVATEWTHPYPRELAVYPVHTLVRTKYWPPVRRIDNAYGDRNLVCACPPVEAFA